MEAENKQELMKLATLHYNAGNYDKALETYQKALTIDPIDLRAKHGLARSLASLRRCKEALEEFDWVLRHDGLPNTWYSELYKQRGDVYFEMQIYVNLHDKAMLYDDVLQNFLKALDDYDRALVLNPKNEEAARMRAQVNTYYLQQREKLGKNDKIFGYTPYYKKEASLQSRTNESNQHINNKSAFSKTKEQWLQEGINHYLAEDYTNSLLACEQAIQLDANYARAYYGKGLTLRRCSKDQEALLAFEHAIELDAAYSKAYYGKGNILYKQHRYEEALAVYNYAIHLNPIFAAACSGKGASLIALQRYEEALAAYDQVILLDPDFTITKASFLFEIDRYDEAAIAYDQVLQLHPNDPIAYFMKGVSHLYSARNEEALAAFKKAISLCNDTYIISRYDKARHYDESRYIGEIYADISKLFSGLEGFQDALEDLKQCYEDICKKIDKKIDEETRAMFGLDENDNDEYDDEFTGMQCTIKTKGIA